MESDPQFFDLFVVDRFEFADRGGHNQRFGAEFGDFQMIERVDQLLARDQYRVVRL